MPPYGETDEVGHLAAVDKVTPNDYQATLLHLFGLEHDKIVYHHNGQEQQLTAGRAARIVREILARGKFYSARRPGRRAEQVLPCGQDHVQRGVVAA